MRLASINFFGFIENLWFGGRWWIVRPVAIRTQIPMRPVAMPTRASPRAAYAHLKTTLGAPGWFIAVGEGCKADHTHIRKMRHPGF